MNLLGEGGVEQITWRGCHLDDLCQELVPSDRHVFVFYSAYLSVHGVKNIEVGRQSPREFINLFPEHLLLFLIYDLTELVLHLLLENGVDVSANHINVQLLVIWVALGDDWLDGSNNRMEVALAHQLNLLEQGLE